MISSPKDLDKNMYSGINSKVSKLIPTQVLSIVKYILKSVVHSYNGTRYKEKPTTPCKKSS